MAKMLYKYRVLVLVVGLILWTKFVLGPIFDIDEIAPSGYAVLAREYPALTKETKQVINNYLSKGYIRQDEVMPIYEAILKEKKTINTYPAPNYGDKDEGFNTYLLNGLLGKETESNAKTKLKSLAGV